MSSQPPESKVTLAPTILGAFQQFASQDAIASSSLHPFASTPDENISVLRKLLETANQASLSLNAHISLPLSNPKLLSLYRQETIISHAVQQADQNVRHVVTSLRKRVGITFGEDIPLDRSQLPEWFLKRLLEWGTSAGMEAFNEPEREGRSTVLLGGKVLMVELNFSIDRTNLEQPKINITTCKTSYDTRNSTATSSAGNSASLDGLLADAIRGFLTEVQKEDAERDSVEASRLGDALSDHFAYLMKLDHLALSEGEGGLRWFNFIDRMSLDLEKLAGSEAEAISRQESGAKVPLDIFLLRSHALPLPYLTIPSISFLVYLSPLAYLKLLRTTSAPSTETNHLPKLDVPFHHLRASLTSYPRLPGATLATLVLSPTAPPSYAADSMSMSALDTRSSSSLVPSAADMEHVFPTARETQGPQGQQYTWILDFTDGGKFPGVVMSQSRMHEVELVVNPFSGMDHMDNVQMMSFGTGSWVDLLLNSQTPISPERYTTTYISPTSVHPHLQLRLTTPDEPGFVLEAVPVRTLKEVWSILEIVREQCWLNETLSSCHWVPEGLDANTADADGAEDISVNEDDLQAVLKGTVKPRSIPVNVYLPAHAPADTLFGGPDMDAFSLGVGGGAPPRRARVVMTTPERPPISGLVEIGVTFDPARPRGVAVDVSGAMGVDLRVDMLEEVCRRGGLFGLPGRVWKKAHGPS